MFCLSTEYGNSLDLADSVLNSLEINGPFISCINRELKYFEKAAEAILAAMDGFSKAVEGPAF